MKLSGELALTLTLQQGKKEQIFYDDELRGFGLRLRAGGSRTWVYTYKTGSKHRRITLGTTATVTHEVARGWARELRLRVLAGEDPAVESNDRRRRDRGARKSLQVASDSCARSLANNTDRILSLATVVEIWQCSCDDFDFVRHLMNIVAERRNRDAPD